MQPQERKYSTAEVAKLAGVHRDTLLRWLRQGQIPEPHRDRRGWRLFTQRETEQIVRYSTPESAYGLPHRQIQSAGVATGTARLASLDWDFVDAKTDYLTHNLHPYPAKFIPQIPNALIQELSSVGDTVADVFVGSGTTLVEALTLKRHAIGLDANPLACLISSAKTARFAEGDSEKLMALVTRAQEYAGIASLPSPNLFGTLPFTSDARRPGDKAIDFWFEPFVVDELAEILSWCRNLNGASVRNVALTAFSSIIVAVSRQDSDTRYVRRNKNTQPGDVFTRFAQSLERAVHSVNEFTELVEPRFRTAIFEKNILDGPDIGQVDLVVSSPPYPNAYSYHLYHMTRMVWLGMEQPSFKKIEIGSHRKYSSRGRNGASVQTFTEEMETIFRWLRRHLKPNKYACFVVGDSTINGNTIDNAELLSGAASRAGFVEVERISRNLQATKKYFNPKIGKIKSERILVLQNTVVEL
jgi:excisionase family DNA binding protein